METLVKDKKIVEKKEIDWVSPYSDAKVTLSDYRNEMYAAERSGDIHYEQFQTNMHQWLTKNL